jgi:hypothetical protein
MTKTNPRRLTRWIAITLTASGLTVAAAAVAAKAGGTSTTTRSPSTITVYGTALKLPNDGFVDVDNNHKPSVGDEFLIADVLKNRAPKRVGIDRGTCTIIHLTAGNSNTPHGENSCIGTVALKDGTLTFQGIEYFLTRNTVNAAITGGTGRYHGALGAVRVTLHHGGNSSTWTFHLTN